MLPWKIMLDKIFWWYIKTFIILLRKNKLLYNIYNNKIPFLWRCMCSCAHTHTKKLFKDIPPKLTLMSWLRVILKYFYLSVFSKGCTLNMHFFMFYFFKQKRPSVHLPHQEGQRRLKSWIEELGKGSIGTFPFPNSRTATEIIVINSCSFQKIWQ